MIGRREDGSGSVKVRISWGDTKPLTNILIGLSFELRNRGSEAGGWGRDLFRGFVSPRLILTFTLPDPSSRLPIMLDPFSVLPSQTRRIHHHSHSPKHIESILTPTLPNTSNPSSLSLFQAYRIHSHSHPHEHARFILTPTHTSMPDLLDTQHKG